jgi:hypothetical protein
MNAVRSRKSYSPGFVPKSCPVFISRFQPMFHPYNMHIEYYRRASTGDQYQVSGIQHPGSEPAICYLQPARRVDAKRRRATFNPIQPTAIRLNSTKFDQIRLTIFYYEHKGVVPAVVEI